MSRRQFIESHGATCRNWTWSWSFVNENEKWVIFGAWDHLRDGNRSLIFSENWQRDHRGRKKNAYNQSREHIRLVEERGYQLKTFPQKKSDSNKDQNGVSPPKIGSFDPTLTNKFLIRVGDNCYASDDELIIGLQRGLPHRTTNIYQVNQAGALLNSRRQRDGHGGVKS